MCKVPGKVRRVIPQFTDVNTPWTSAAAGLEPISNNQRRRSTVAENNSRMLIIGNGYTSLL